MITLKLIAGVLLGGAAGYLYQRMVGCGTGTCPLTSNPVVTAIYGAIVGLSLAVMR